MARRPVQRKESGPYIMNTDAEGHVYIIPERREDDFNAWAHTSESDGSHPPWADPVGGSPTLVVFPQYIIK